MIQSVVRIVLMVEKGVRSRSGFALATVLIASVVLLSVLVGTIGTIVAVRSSLNDQEYTRLAELAAEAGNQYAKACMADNNGQATWTDAKPLKPSTNCNGDVITGAPEYVMQDEKMRTYFIVPAPIAKNISAKGYVEVVRTSTGLAWRVWSANVAAASTTGDSVPVGTSIEGYWTSAPTGYLLENGAAVSRTTYADLFAVIGTTFGAGNGTTTFNLPDSRGRVAVNQSSDTEFNTLGKKSGEKTHTLTVNEMPSHTHTQNPHNHLSGVAVTNGGNAGNYRSIFATNSPFWSRGDSNNPVSSTTATNQNTGGGAAHNNIQPSIVVLRVIKY